MSFNNSIYENPSMKKTVLLWTIIAACMLFSCSYAYSATADAYHRGDTVKEEIWALEEAYFANLYKANYEGVLAIVHSQFLGWQKKRLDYFGELRMK